MDLKKVYEEARLHKKKIKDFKTGDMVKVHIRIKEAEKERIQVFEGTVISKKNRGIDSSFTVRKRSYGVGVERVFSMYSPSIDRIEVVTPGKIRRSKMYYLREIDHKKLKMDKDMPQDIREPQ